jgi:hypothetical protein
MARVSSSAARRNPAAERAELRQALETSIAQAKAGQLIDADEVIAELLARR